VKAFVVVQISRTFFGGTGRLVMSSPTGQRIIDFAHRTLIISLVGLAAWSSYGAVRLAFERYRRRRQGIPLQLPPSPKSDINLSTQLQPKTDTDG